MKMIVLCHKRWILISTLTLPFLIQYVSSLTVSRNSGRRFAPSEFTKRDNVEIPTTCRNQHVQSTTPVRTKLLSYQRFSRSRHSLTCGFMSSLSRSCYNVLKLQALPELATMNFDDGAFGGSGLSFLPLALNDVANGVLNMEKDTAEFLAGPLFGASLFPYLAFLYFIARPENETPKGVIVGFSACLLFVFLTIPAAIAAKILYGATLADCDWLHGSAESMLTITNLVTVIPFRQAIAAKQMSRQDPDSLEDVVVSMPRSATEYAPTLTQLAILTVLATLTAIFPLVNNAHVHSPYLNGIMDLQQNALVPLGANFEPENALTVATWIIHVSSLVEFLVAMGFCWRWADIINNPKWKGLTWGLLPLHSSGITACVSHLFYNNIAVLVPLQALLTCVGNTTAAWAAYRIARSNGWNGRLPQFTTTNSNKDGSGSEQAEIKDKKSRKEERKSLVGFEDLGEALAKDNDFYFLVKLFAGCAVTSYVVKYGELFFDFPNDSNNIYLALSFISIPSSLNAYKWFRRSQDPTFEGWF